MRAAGSSEEESDEALLKLLEDQPPEQVPKTPSIPSTPPRSPEVQLRAPMVGTKGTKRLMEELKEPGGVRYGH